MRGQSHRNFCGPATVANILRAYGYDREATEDKVARKIKLTNSTTDEHPARGATERQIMAALGAYKLPHDQIQIHQPGLALSALRGYLDRGVLAVLCVDNSEHWLLALATMGERVVVVDTADPELTLSYTPKELVARWGEVGDPPTYYAIVVYPRTKAKVKKV